MKALVTGATGFIGKHLCSLLDDPVVLTRDPARLPVELSGFRAYRWDPTSAPPPEAAFEGIDTVFHLAGEPVAEGRWTNAKKAAIRDSRTVGTSNLVSAIAALDQLPSVLVSASAVGYYGSRGDEVLTEEAPPAEGFLPDVCREWEAQVSEAEALGVRTASIRIGLVLGKDGGALDRMLPIFKLAAGGRLGNGKQWMPWIHVEDLARLFIHAAEVETVRGPLNAAAPNPVTNNQFTQVLAKAVSRPAIFPAPEFALRLALGEFADVLLASQRVVPRAALNAGFEFQYRELDAALAAITA